MGFFYRFNVDGEFGFIARERILLLVSPVFDSVQLLPLFVLRYIPLLVPAKTCEGEFGFIARAMRAPPPVFTDVQSPPPFMLL